MLKIKYPKLSLQKAREELKKDFEQISQTDKTLVKYQRMRTKQLSKLDAQSKGYAVYKKDFSTGNKNLDDYLKDELKLFRELFEEIAGLLDELFTSVENINSADNKDFNSLNNQRNRARSVAEVAKYTYDKLNINTETTLFKEFLAAVKKIESGNNESISDEIKNVGRLMFRLVQEGVYELVAMASVVGTIVQSRVLTRQELQKMFKEQKIQHTGPAGNKAGSELGTTDFTFLYGKMRIGVDVKADREIYKKEYSEKNALYNIIESVLSNSMPHGLVKMTHSDTKGFMDMYAYVLTNMLTMKTIANKGLGVPNAKPYSETRLRNFAMIPLQQVAMISGTAKFIDEYLALFDNNLRKQLLILMGDRIMFISEFIREIQKKMYEVLDMRKYDSVGFVDLPTLKLDNNVKITALEAGLPETLLANMISDKIQLQRDLLNTSKQPQGTGSLYPELFTGLKSQMAEIAEQVLGKKFKLTMKFTFNQFKK